MSDVTASQLDVLTLQNFFSEQQRDALLALHEKLTLTPAFNARKPECILQLGSSILHPRWQSRPLHPLSPCCVSHHSLWCGEKKHIKKTFICCISSRIKTLEKQLAGTQQHGAPTIYYIYKKNSLQRPHVSPCLHTAHQGPPPLLHQPVSFPAADCKSLQVNVSSFQRIVIVQRFCRVPASTRPPSLYTCVIRHREIILRNTGSLSERQQTCPLKETTYLPTQSKNRPGEHHHTLNVGILLCCTTKQFHIGSLTKYKKGSGERKKKKKQPAFRLCFLGSL